MGKKEKNYSGIIERITRDISDGLLLFDLEGRLVYINPSAEELLDDPNLREGFNCRDYLDQEDSCTNAGFYKYLIESIEDKESTHSGTVTYTYADGSEHYFQVKSSFVFSEDGTEQYGVILQFTDVTETHNTQIKYRDAVIVLVAMIVLLSAWCIVYALWDYLHHPIRRSAMTLIIELIGTAGALLALKFTSLTVHDLGLGKGTDLKKTMINDGTVTAVMLAVMIAVKLIVYPDEPLFYWSRWTTACTLYPLTVIAQELLSRGVAQSCLILALPDETPEVIPIVISSLFFGALHLHKGLMFMLGATLLLSVFGFIYNRQKTIWGLCIPHYFLGLSLTVIWAF